MKITMVLYDVQDFGGLEEYAVTLAASLRRLGHEVSVLSTTWTSCENQYMKMLIRSGIRVLQPPRWLSLPASDWQTKEAILSRLMVMALPVVVVLACGKFMLGGRPWRQSIGSAHNWVQGQLMSGVIGPDRRAWLAKILLYWWRWRWRPDVLHLHGYTTNLLFLIDWGFKHAVPVVYEEHQTPDAQFDWWSHFEGTINKASVVVAVSETSAQALRSVCGVTRPILVRTSNIADPMAAGWRLPLWTNSQNETVRVATVARLYVTKGLVYLLDAIPQVLERHPNVTFRVYGDGPLRAELMAHAANLGLDANAIFVGMFTREQLSDLMSETDIFVLPSLLEGQPLAMVEAMAHGRPIVATAVGGVPEVLIDGVNGLLCSPADPNGLASKVNQLLDDPALCARLGRAARASYEQGPFQPDSVAEQLVAIYEQALQEGSMLSAPRKQVPPFRPKVG